MRRNLWVGQICQLYSLIKLRYIQQSMYTNYENDYLLHLERCKKIKPDDPGGLLLDELTTGSTPSSFEIFVDLYKANRFIAYKYTDLFFFIADYGTNNLIAILPDNLVKDARIMGAVQFDEDEDVGHTKKELRKFLGNMFNTWIGARWESSKLFIYDMPYRAGFRMYNLPNTLEAPGFEEVLDIEKLPMNGILADNRDGQEKLRIIESPFHITHELSIMIGGSPATRFVKHPLKDRRTMIIIDPAEVADGVTCVSHIQRKYSTDILEALLNVSKHKSIFFSIDIRSNVPTHWLFNKAFSRDASIILFLQEQYIDYEEKEGVVYLTSDSKFDPDLIIECLPSRRIRVYNDTHNEVLGIRDFISCVIYGKLRTEWDKVLKDDFKLIVSIIGDILRLRPLTGHTEVTILYKIRPWCSSHKVLRIPKSVLLIQPYTQTRTSEIRGLITNRSTYAVNMPPPVSEVTLVDFEHDMLSIAKIRSRIGGHFNRIVSGYWSHFGVSAEPFPTTNACGLFSLSNLVNPYNRIVGWLREGIVMTLPYSHIFKNEVKTDVGAHKYKDHCLNILRELELWDITFVPLISYMNNHSLQTYLMNDFTLTMLANVSINPIQRQYVYSTHLVKAVSACLRKVLSPKEFRILYRSRSEALRKNKSKYEKILIDLLSINSIELIVKSAGGSGEYRMSISDKVYSVSGHLMLILLASIFGIPYGIRRYIYEKEENILGHNSYEDKGAWKIWHTLIDDIAAIDATIIALTEWNFPATILKELDVKYDILRNELLRLGRIYDVYITAKQDGVKKRDIEAVVDLGSDSEVTLFLAGVTSSHDTKYILSEEVPQLGICLDFSYNPIAYDIYCFILEVHEINSFIILVGQIEIEVPITNKMDDDWGIRTTLVLNESNMKNNYYVDQCKIYVRYDFFKYLIFSLDPMFSYNAGSRISSIVTIGHGSHGATRYCL
uniref:Uncharacterized protein n=1 Tax=Hubei blood fluke virus 3 TaxID=1922841 RepID=A0A1L3KP64_9VIRU|nr:hypothetical protein 3 [Hubei blood fluke virus 3]